MSEHTLNFTLSSVLTVDGLGQEIEVGPHKYTAYYWEHDNGQVSVTEVRRDGLRAKMSSEVCRDLELMLEKQISREHQALVSLYDEESRRLA